MWKRFSPRNQGSDSTRFNSHIEEEIIYIWYAREKEDKTNQARESDNETKKPYRGERESRTTKQRSRTEGSERAGQRNKEAVQGGAREPDNETKKPYRGERESRTTEQRESDRATRKPNNETKKAEQESEGVEHPLTFGSYINNQIGK